jgi:hypothetical protein
MPDIVNSDTLSPRQRVPYEAQPPDPVDYGAAPFYFPTSLPSLGVDLSAFTFSPMPIRAGDHGHGQGRNSTLHIPESLSFQDPSTDVETYADLNCLPRLAVIPMPSTRSPFISQAPSTSDDIPVLVKDKRQPPFCRRTRRCGVCVPPE